VTADTAVSSGSQALGPQAHAAQAPDPRPIAFFDLDGTLVAGHTHRLLISFMRRKGRAGLLFYLAAQLWFIAFNQGIVRPNLRARVVASQLFKGLTVAEGGALMAELVRDGIGPHFDPQTVTALARHQAAGDRVIVLTAAAEPLVRAVADRLRVAEIWATGFEIVDGRYTGRLDTRLMFAGRKVDLARQVIAAAAVDPARCAAYADHESDLPLLRLVGHPTVVRPRPGMRAIARREGWPVFEARA